MNRVGVDWSAGDGDETVTRDDDSGEAEEQSAAVKAKEGRERPSGYSHCRPMRVQCEQAGSVSWHLTFLRLQL